MSAVRIATAIGLVGLALGGCEQKPAGAPSGQAPPPANTNTAPPATPPGEAAPAAGEAPSPAASEETPVPKPPAEVPLPAPMTTASGLVIEELVVGTGRVCEPGATVTVHYKGTLTNGTKFDSSYDRDTPATFPLANLIKGWQEGIPGMKVGGKRKLTVPYQLAYGEEGRPPTIPPRSTLVFEIELLGIR